MYHLSKSYRRKTHGRWKEERKCKACLRANTVGWLCWGLTSQSTIFQSCRDGAIASWVINQYFRGVKCLAQGHNTAEVGLEPRTSRSGVRHSTTEPPRSPELIRDEVYERLQTADTTASPISYHWKCFQTQTNKTNLASVEFRQQLSPAPVPQPSNVL